MSNAHLLGELRQIISSAIHIAKCKCDTKLSIEQWKAIDSDKISEDAIKQIVSIIEAWIFLPCCHTSGMHDPRHFDDRKYICEDQKAKALERFCADLGINPVTRSVPDCGWCAEYLHYRKGEGFRLFNTNAVKEVQR